ncbi:MAG: trigger factor [Planctomycetes bacterium]|nr:trigger factor [Planctomycetota bacterium]
MAANDEPRNEDDDNAVSDSGLEARDARLAEVAAGMVEQGFADDELAGEEAEAKPKLSLTVKIDKPGACERHITIAVSRADINRYLDEAFAELTPKAEVRGFRAGRAPRRLVEHQYKDQIRNQVKSSLLLDSLQQISEEHAFSAISEPDFDIEKVEVPDAGPMTFEFDIEVRPEFEMPNWKGLGITRPVYSVTPEDVDRHMKQVLDRFSRQAPVDRPAELDDFVAVNIVCRRADEVIRRLDNRTFRVRKQLSLADATVPGFGSAMVGCVAGDKREVAIRIHESASDESLRGREIQGEFEILEVRRQEHPSITPAILDELGGFVDEGELRDTVAQEIRRRFVYHQRRAIREQITRELTAGANWELPTELLRKQARRELDRIVLELQSSGFSAEEIQAHSNRLGHNVVASTAVLLREHFILERIAEDEKIEPTERDYDLEIHRIALARNESPRRVRARLEKRGQMDTLRNQILEAIVIDRVMEEATFQDVPFAWPDADTAATADHICEPVADAIPVAQAGDSEELRQPAERG